MQQYWPLHERSHAHPRQSLTARATAASKVIGLLGGQLEGTVAAVVFPCDATALRSPRRHLAENCESARMASETPA